VSCSVSRVATRESRERVATYESRDTLREQVIVAVRDTIVETTTITVDRNEVGDTLFRSVVTDRTRAASRDHIAAYKTKTVIKMDTVYVERRDSVLVKNTNVKSRDSPFQRVLRLILWIVVGLIALGIFNFYVSSARRK
jgi:hypothetical protein